MRSLIAGLVLALMADPATAQQRIPPEQAQNDAKFLAGKAAHLDPLPLRIYPAPDNAMGWRLGEWEVLILPDKDLSDATLPKVGKDPTPVAQLWCRNLAPVIEGKATAKDKLRIVKVGDQKPARTLFLLGMRKTAAGSYELLIYGNGQAPLLILPLQEANEKLDLPIRVLLNRVSEDRVQLAINVLGEYRARLAVAQQPP
jgi:hypothetical protein